MTAEHLHGAKQPARLLLGAPGTGKTERLLRAAQEFLDSGADPAHLLVLTPSRVSATRFREELSSRISATVSTAPVRAWQAYAFDLLRRAHVGGYLPGVEFSPKLLSGPEQDVLIRELLEGHRQGHGASLTWPQDLREALGTKGFRHEVRDFFDRLAEHDLSAAAVQELGQQTGRAEWVAVGKLYAEYRQIRALRAPQAFDAAALIHEAVKVLLAHPEFLAAERSRFEVVLVDDVQELTPSIYRLLSALVGRSLDDLLSHSRSSLQGMDEQTAEHLALAFGAAPRVMLACCTDTVVQGFRGAVPQLASGLTAMMGELVQEQLTVSYRMPEAVASSWAAVVSRLPAVPGAVHPRQLSFTSRQVEGDQALLPLGDDGALLDPEKAADPHPAVLGLTVESAQHESRLLGQMILEDHLYRGRSYRRSAIIVRNGSDVTRIKRALTGLGVPVQTAAAITPVRDEPAARPFLDALGLLLHTRSLGEAPETVPTENQASTEGRNQLTQTGEVSPFIPAPGSAWGLGVDTALSLLTSRLGGASTAEIRRLRQHLRAADLRAGRGRNSDELLVEALIHPELLPTSGAGRAASRLASVLKAGNIALDQPGATAETVLWALWEASGLAAEWKKLAAGTGTAADRANRDIDAMIGLFEAAERYTDQMPGATAEQFLTYIDAQDLPMDTLAERTGNRDAVEIMTPALAAGRQWETVYIAGLQEGTWPNTTVRGSLLGTQDLVDLATGATPGSGRLLERLKETRFDEFRMFSTAVSRASYRVVCTAVSSADEAASELLDIFAPAPGGERSNSEVRRPMTLRSLIAELRQWAESQHISPSKADAAARLLNRLSNTENTAGLGLPGVNPAHWWGLLPLSSSTPAFEGDGPVPISPSQLEKIHRSPLDWFVSASKAEAATDASRSLGTLIHSICEDFPDAPGHQLREELHRRLPTLGLPDTWESRKTIERAEQMVSKFASYVAELPGKGRELVGVEGSFTVLVPGPARDALLSGRVDRIEKDQLGRFIIIDLKTGKSKPSKADLEKHPQLAAYQVALEAGAGQLMQKALTQDQAEQEHSSDQRPDGSASRETLEFTGLRELSGGALLLQIGDSTKSYGEQAQAPLDTDSAWAVKLINRAAELIAGEQLQARHAGGGAFGIGCALPDICPLCSRGRQITVRSAL